MSIEISNKNIELPVFLENAPDEIVEIYNEWKIDHDKLLNRPDRYIETKRPSNNQLITIDCMWPNPVIRKKLSGCKKEEINRILDKSSEFQREKSRLLHFKNKYMKYNSGKKDMLSVLQPYSSNVLELFGQFKTINEVQKIIYETWGIQLSNIQVARFKNKNKDTINKLKSEWENNYDDFSITKKKGRIERLVYLLQTQTDEYKRSNTFPVVRSKEIRETLDQIRKELEGDKLKIDINGNIDVNASINMNMSVQQITQKVSINSLIIGLVAVKRGLDPTKLMYQLQNSYYKNYNGFITSDKEEEMTYPSNLINQYDWAAIEKKHKDIEEAQIIEEQKAKQPIVNKPVETINPEPEPKEDLKAKLQELMAKRNAELEKGRIKNKK